MNIVIIKKIWKSIEKDIINMNEKKRTKKTLLETLIILEKCNFKTICLKDYFLGIVFQGNIEEAIKYVKSNYDNEETKECVDYTLHFPHAVIEVGI